MIENTEFQFDLSMQRYPEPVSNYSFLIEPVFLTELRQTIFVTVGEGLVYQLPEVGYPSDVEYSGEVEILTEFA